MPIYEYRCEACGHNFETLVFGFEKEDVECPECKSKKVWKEMSAAGFLGGGKSAGACGPGAGKFS